MLLEGETAQAESRHGRLVMAARVGLALAWLCWAAMAWWSTPRSTDIAQLKSDFAAGRVTSFAEGNYWQWRRLWGLNESQSSSEATVTWATRDGHTHYVEREWTPIDGTSRLYEGDELVRQLSFSNLTGSGLSPLYEFANSMTWALALSALGLLLMGPAPARGTRPFWFWVGQIPFGLGFVGWLAFERPWSRQAEGAVKKSNGWLGFAYLVIGGIVLSLLVWGARDIFGPWVIPK